MAKKDSRGRYEGSPPENRHPSPPKSPIPGYTVDVFEPPISELDLKANAIYKNREIYSNLRGENAYCIIGGPFIFIKNYKGDARKVPRGKKADILVTAVQQGKTKYGFGDIVNLEDYLS